MFNRIRAIQNEEQSSCELCSSWGGGKRQRYDDYETSCSRAVLGVLLLSDWLYAV